MSLQKPGVLLLSRHVINYDSSEIRNDHVTANYLNEVVTNRFVIADTLYKFIGLIYTTNFRLIFMLFTISSRHSQLFRYHL